MTLNLPLVVVFGFFAWAAVKYLGVRTWIVVLIALFGALLPEDAGVRELRWHCPPRTPDGPGRSR
ncbi:hypothetical protein ACFSL4_23535 [Streptomyces caeni]|uniref:Uncharacterized protein n=1 Tax=Streptomyces caeni TaxID=2307231 RepID=A0ABW4IXT1_9ACTN